ncbi:GGDEF domain-containing protein [Vibrio cincinnatiensis]|uniref:sensor domain-containing diguanylate cyclase n=1 Tax=Vibrio cincinnatiensis TaxID=675 RepID=UPI001EE05A6A|nr:diguanylate cyclase [Vibrio cincinnatiensis]MCG3747765.1 GGDEF domain-containing protein [Vibrio cincinnatiensis]
MKKREHAKIILLPLAIALMLLASVAYSYLKVVNTDIDEEYTRIERQLGHAVKMMVALDYSFTNYFESTPASLLGFQHEVFDGLCKMWPKISLAPTDIKSHATFPIEVSYMMVGEAELCDESHPAYLRMTRKMSLAPIVSFLNDLDKYIVGVHYIADGGYVISSPDVMVKELTKSNLVTLKLRPFWHLALEQPDLVTVTGPSNQMGLLSKSNTFTLAAPIFHQKQFQGVVAIDVGVDKLTEKTTRLVGKISVEKIDKDKPLASYQYRPKVLNVGYAQFNHRVYYHWDWIAEARHFFYDRQTSLYAVLLAYFMSVIGMFFLNIRVEKTYYADLAARDPMTGLLNRRGMEEFLQGKQHNQYLAIAVLDIDNFKSINDSFGHDVGDQVIRYIGEQIESHLRDTDAVARFGGEEFVLYVTASEEPIIENVMYRVKDAIVQDSTRLIDQGFTVSGGVHIVRREEGDDFNKLFKAADEKLYVAKTSGKDKLVF